MSKCELSIELDREDRTYRAGETVRGRVIVRASEPVRCDALTVEHYWATHGRGSVDKTSGEVAQLHAGQVERGEHEHPFELHLPLAPLTYHGHLVSIDHHVAARADVPWATDPKADEDFRLEPGRSVETDEATWGLPSTASLSTSPEPGCLARGAGYPIGGLLAAYGLFGSGVSSWVALAAGALFLFFTIRPRLVRKKLGEVHLELDDIVAHPGGTVPVRVRFTPRETVRLNGIVATLKACETCQSGSGTNKTTHEHELLRSEQRLCAERSLPAGKEVVFRGTFELPETAAYSFSAPSNEVTWTVEVRVDVPSWPDWTHRRHLAVVPEIRAAARLGGDGAAPASRQPPAQRADLQDRVEAPAEERGAALASVAAAMSAVAARHGTPAAERPPIPAPEPRQELPAPRRDDAAALGEAFDRLSAVNRYAPERASLRAELAERTYRFGLEVEGVRWSMGIELPDGYGRGRTVHGTARGASVPLAVRFPDGRNDEVEGFEVGSVREVEVRIAGWDDIFRRGMVDAV